MVLMAAMMLVAMATGITSAAADPAVRPGLDIVILLDISYSNMIGSTESPNPYDKEMMCLDAAAMLINMCDAEYSRVAVVPFSDTVRVEDKSNVFVSWVDVSSPSARRALCDELYCKHMVSDAAWGGSETGWHNGITNRANALEKARELMNERTTNNPVLVVMLGDSRGASEEEISRSIDIVGDIEADGATIYTLDLGTYAESETSDLILYQIASGEGSAKSKYYWSDVTPDDLKIRFSNIFADMIGSTRITDYATVGDGVIDFKLYIPNRSVDEVNLVLNRGQLADSDFELMYEGKMVQQDDNVLIYSFVEPVPQNGGMSLAARTYDFISIKLIDPEPGNWVVRAAPSEDVDENTQISYDILYNYQLTPVVHALEKDVYYQKDTATFTANFINNEDGSDSTDDALYRGNADPAHPGIEAMLTIYDENDQAVGTYPMTASKENLNFSCEFQMNQLGAIEAGRHVYTYEVNVRGDNMNKTSARASFAIENTAPKCTGSSEIDAPEVLKIENILGQAQGGMLTIEADDLKACFTDDDGDALSYKVTEASGVRANIDNNYKLTIEKDGNGNKNDAYVIVTASDSMGQSANLKINVKVLSVKQMIEEAVSVSVEMYTEEGDQQLVKGEKAKAAVKFCIAAPEGADKNAFPYSYLGSLVNEELLFANAEITFMPEADESIVCESDGDVCNVTAGEVDGATVKLNVEVNIGPEGDVVTKKGESALYTVKNAQPKANDITAALTEAGALVLTNEDGESIVCFEVDKDNESEAHLSFDMTDWFSDADVDNGKDSFTYSVKIETLEETSDIYSFARAILRMIGLTEKDGPIVCVAGVEGAADEAAAETMIYGLGGDATLKLDALRFGNARVTVTATDNSGENVEQNIEYCVSSSRETLLCIIVYILLLIILIVIIIILYDKLIVHQPWPSKREPGYCIQLNGFDQMTMVGDLESKFHVTGRGTAKLSVLAKQFEIADGGAGHSVFSKIELWPTTGSNIVVEPAKKATVKGVKVEGQPLDKKRKWPRNGRIVVTYEDEGGNVYECVFKRL